MGVTMPIIPLFPGATNPQNIAQEAFEREVAARFGLVPNFFRSAPDAPFVIHELWLFVKAAYLDNPIPTLFKERLFVYLSRFCEMRYCITRHVGLFARTWSVSRGPECPGDDDHPSRPSATTTRLPTKLLRAALTRLEAVAAAIDWPTAETSHDDDLFTSLTMLFLQPARAVRAKRALRNALGGDRSRT